MTWLALKLISETFIQPNIYFFSAALTKSALVTLTDPIHLLNYSSLRPAQTSPTPGETPHHKRKKLSECHFTAGRFKARLLFRYTVPLIDTRCVVDHFLSHHNCPFNKFRMTASEEGKVGNDALAMMQHTQQVPGGLDGRAPQNSSVLQHNAELRGVKGSRRLLDHQQMLLCSTEMRGAPSYLHLRRNLVREDLWIEPDVVSQLCFLTFRDLFHLPRLSFDRNRPLWWFFFLCGPLRDYRVQTCTCLYCSHCVCVFVPLILM